MVDKRYYHLCPQITTFENLLLAYRKAARGKRSRAAASFEFRLEEHLVELHQELTADSYRPGGYTNFLIHDPKRRLISAAPFRVRVVHHALMNMTGPILERSFVEDSYANRVDKGTHRAVVEQQ